MERLKVEKILRHLDNLRIFTGFFHSKFFWRGESKPNLGSRSGHLKNKNSTAQGKQIK